MIVYKVVTDKLQSASASQEDFPPAYIITYKEGSFVCPLSGTYIYVFETLEQAKKFVGPNNHLDLQIWEAETTDWHKPAYIGWYFAPEKFMKAMQEATDKGLNRPNPKFSRPIDEVNYLKDTIACKNLKLIKRLDG